MSSKFKMFAVAGALTLALAGSFAGLAEARGGGGGGGGDAGSPPEAINAAVAVPAPTHPGRTRGLGASDAGGPAACQYSTIRGRVVCSPPHATR